MERIGSSERIDRFERIDTVEVQRMMIANDDTFHVFIYWMFNV